MTQQAYEKYKKESEKDQLIEQPQDWLFTFGFGQEYPNKFLRIYGTYKSARKEMVKRFGQKWSMQYPADQEQYLKRYLITELKG